MKFFKIWAIALVTLLGFTACEKECIDDIVYSETFIGNWSYASEGVEEVYEFCADGTFNVLGGDGENAWYEVGTWKLDNNYLVLTTNEGKTFFSGTIAVYAKEVMVMTSDQTKETRVYYYWEPQPFPARLVGTWTCVEPDYAEALIIRADGSLVSTGIENGNYWENKAGSFMNGEGEFGIGFDDDTYRWGDYEIVTGELLVFIDSKTGHRRTYHYCEEDLSDEIVGMWVTQNDNDSGMSIQTYNADGTMEGVGYFYLFGEQIDAFASGTYKVIGDVLFENYVDLGGYDNYCYASRMTYAPKGSSLGDVMTTTSYVAYEDESWESVTTIIRVKQSLNLPGKKYDYSDLYVTNVSGEDKDIDFMGYTFNFAKMDGYGLDKMLKSLLFTVEFPDANTLSYSYHLNGNKETYSVPVEVEGNKITVKMSTKVPTLKDVVLYTFQDVDDSQMHTYMHKKQFVNFFSNMQAMLAAAVDTEFDITNAATIEAIYNDIDKAVESINLSIVMKVTK